MTDQELLNAIGKAGYFFKEDADMFYIVNVGTGDVELAKAKFDRLIGKFVSLNAAKNEREVK
jgi:hypothetical protein